MIFFLFYERRASGFSELRARAGHAGHADPEEEAAEHSASSRQPVSDQNLRRGKDPVKSCSERETPNKMPSRTGEALMSAELHVAVSSAHLIHLLLLQLYRRGVHAHVSGITSETAESFRFRLLHFFKRDTFIDEGGVKLADGGWLIPTKDGTAGKEEFFRYPDVMVTLNLSLVIPI